ncbi:hypothetical protein RRG08_054981 [Elysia crispata]|uniref:Uncharacterized protein n=1 Tax=Elysia crispata TaxID=231223 RepID=A0AAE1DU63_9GAST|nr:hypothetical protein RRG08_054981 [Elysia crispata]
MTRAHAHPHAVQNDQSYFRLESSIPLEFRQRNPTWHCLHVIDPGLIKNRLRPTGREEWDRSVLDPASTC